MKFNTKTWFKAVKNDQLDIIQAFLEKNFDIETTDDTGRTALHVAAYSNSITVATFLLEHTSADIEAKMNDLSTPIMDAVACNHREMTQLFLKHKAKVNVVDEHDWTLMHRIAHKNCTEVIDLIHKKSKKLLLQTLPNGLSPLHLVESVKIAKQLIAIGAPIDAPSKEGNTPLIEAILKNKTDVALCLIKHGANILHENHKGESALTLAQKKNQALYDQLTQITSPTCGKKGKICRKTTDFENNLTMALSDSTIGINQSFIEVHASRRVDLFFYLLIAYYQTNLSVHIAETHLQHGKGSKKIKQTAACHSAILTAVWDTLHTAPSNDKSYQTSILNGTHFENSLNATVELNHAVNYFDTNYIEGRSKTNLQLRHKALTILNKVSAGQIDPIEGVNRFLTKTQDHLLKGKNRYLNHKKLQTSPKATRPEIFNAQYKGTFFNSCGIETPKNPPEQPKLQDDYITLLLGSSKERKEYFQGTDNFFTNENKKMAVYASIKKEMDLPIQYQTIRVNNN